MTTAVDDGLIARNPVRIKGASAEPMIERPLLTWDDVRALAGAIHPRFECLVWTAAASGLRFGELAGLTIGHVNLERRELRVMQALHDIKGQGPTLGPPKTESAVRLAAHIEEYVEDAEPDALVFTSLRGGPLLNTYFAPQWSKARDAFHPRVVIPSRAPTAVLSEGASPVCRQSVSARWRRYWCSVSPRRAGRS